MSDPKMIKEIINTVTIPVMAKARIGHFVECQVRPIPALDCLFQHTHVEKENSGDERRSIADEVITDSRSHWSRLH
jgi:hypothetical protein